MNKDGSIIIADFQKGQAQSPYLGFDTMRGVDIFSTQGVARLSNKTSLRTNTFTGLIVAFCKDSQGNNYYLSTLDNISYLYMGTSLKSTFTGQAFDMIFYRNTVLVRHGTSISAVQTNVGGYPVYTDWQTGFNANYYSKMIVSKNDGNVYISNGLDIKRLSNFVFFFTPSAPTATLDTAIVLPSGYATTTMVELGSRLMVGTQTSNVFWSERQNSTEAVIFPYRIGVSAVNFDNPIVIGGKNLIQQMIAVNNLMYIIAGLKGELYVSNGTSYRYLKNIPFYNRDEAKLGAFFLPNAITINPKGNILVGSSFFNNGWTNEATQHGVYEININGNNEISMPFILSNGEITGNVLNIGFLAYKENDFLEIGWQFFNNYGLDEVAFFKYTDSAIIESQLYVVGSKLQPKTFQHMEIRFGKPLTEGQYVKVSYRKDSISPYTVIGTYNFATFGAETNIYAKASVQSTSLLQIKIEMGTEVSATITPDQNIDLLSVTLW
jgi:hypothetical protein